MQALGNDFMVIDTINHDFIPTTKQIRQFSSRHFGVGFDQMLIIAPPKNQAHDYFYQIFNADGAEVGQCGNGARCAFRYIQTHLNSKAKKIILATNTTLIELEETSNQLIKMTLPSPLFKPEDIPIDVGRESEVYELSKHLKVHALSVGNPHAIHIIQDKLWDMDIMSLGLTISRHPLFPEQANANFMQIDSKTQISLRVFERGVGETLACGSGALASAIAGMRFHGLNARVLVKLKGGCLEVYWPNQQGPIYQYGPAVEVFRGQILTN